MAESATRPDVVVRPLRESDLPAADEIMRVAFGTFLGMPEPRTFMGDAAFVQPRWRSNPGGAIAAEAHGTLVGSNFATRWGSFGFFGPLTVRPDLWGRGVGKHLLEPVLGCFEAWHVTHAGLFTFAHSQKHVGLYQRFGFWPRFLTAIMAKPVSAEQPAPPDWSALSRTPPEQRAHLLRECRNLTDAVYDGLDLSDEIEAVAAFRPCRASPCNGRIKKATTARTSTSSTIGAREPASKYSRHRGRSGHMPHVRVALGRGFDTRLSALPPNIAPACLCQETMCGCPDL